MVGGGILGVATAAACHGAGLGSVLLIETGRLGAGATGGATGLLIPEPHQWSDPEPLVDLERASLERWRELEQAAARRRRAGRARLGRPGAAPGRLCRAPAARPWSGWPRARWTELIPGLARSMEGALIRRQARVNPLRAVGQARRGTARGGHRRRRHRVTVRGDRLMRWPRRRATSARASSSSPPAAAGARRPAAEHPVGPGQGPPAGHRAHRRSGCRASSRRWPPRSRTGGCSPAEPSISATRLRPCSPMSSSPSWTGSSPPSRAEGAGRRLPVVLLPAPAPRPSPGHRPGARPGQRLADLRALPDRHPERPGHGGGVTRWISAGEPPADPTWSATRFSRRC